MGNGSERASWLNAYLLCFLWDALVYLMYVCPVTLCQRHFLSETNKLFAVLRSGNLFIGVVFNFSTALPRLLGFFNVSEEPVLSRLE